MKRMTIVLATVCALTLAAASGWAIEAGFGVKGGVNFANYIGDDSGSGNDSNLGVCVGLFGVFGLGRLFAIQPEVLYSEKGTQVDVGTTIKENLGYIDFPLLLRVNLPLNLNAYAGPYLGINIYANDKVDGDKTDIKDSVETLDYGIVFGGGIELGKVVLDGRYSLGLAKIATAGQDLKNGVLTFMGGFRFR